MVTAEALIDERERFFQELRNNKTRFIEIVRQMEQGRSEERRVGKECAI